MQIANHKSRRHRQQNKTHRRSLVHCRWISFAALHALYPECLERGELGQNILVSLEIEFLDYAVGFMCISLSRPLWSVSPSALRLRPLSPSRILPPQSSRPSWSVSARAALRRRRAVPPCTAAPELSLRLALPVRCRPGARAF